MIKIEAKNAEKIETMLHEVNGKATAHCYTTYAEIAALVAEFENRLSKLLNKENRKGARYLCISGEALPKAYKHGRAITAVTIEARSTGFFLIAAMRIDRFNRQTIRRHDLILTKEQSDMAIARFMAKYVIRSLR